MQLESRAEANVGAVEANGVVVHVADVEVSAPRDVSIVLRRRPTHVGKSFVFIITFRNS